MDSTLLVTAKSLAKDRGKVFLEKNIPHSRLSQVVLDQVQRKVVRKIENTVGIYDAEALALMSLPDILTNNPVALEEATQELMNLESRVNSSEIGVIDEDKLDKLFPHSVNSRKLLGNDTFVKRSKDAKKIYVKDHDGFPIQLRFDPSIYELENPLMLFFRDLPNGEEYTNMLHQILSLKRPVLLFGTRFLDDDVKKVIGKIVVQRVVMDYIKVDNEDDLYDLANYCGMKVIERSVDNLAYDSINIYDYFDFTVNTLVEKRAYSLLVKSDKVNESWKDTLLRYKMKTDSEFNRDKLDYRIKRYSGHLETLLVPDSLTYTPEYEDLLKYNNFRKIPVRKVNIKFESVIFKKLALELDWDSSTEFYLEHFVKAMKYAIDYLILTDRAYTLRLCKLEI